MEQSSLEPADRLRRAAAELGVHRRHPRHRQRYDDQVPQDRAGRLLDVLSKSLPRAAEPAAPDHHSQGRQVLGDEGDNGVHVSRRGERGAE